MRIQRDRTIDGAHTRLRLSASKKEAIQDILYAVREEIGTVIDKEAHTVQIVFTGDRNETVLTIS